MMCENGRPDRADGNGIESKASSILCMLYFNQMIIHPVIFQRSNISCDDCAPTLSQNNGGVCLGRERLTNYRRATNGDSKFVYLEGGCFATYMSTSPSWTLVCVRGTANHGMIDVYFRNHRSDIIQNYHLRLVFFFKF